MICVVSLGNVGELNQRRARLVAGWMTQGLEQGGDKDSALLVGTSSYNAYFIRSSAISGDTCT